MSKKIIIVALILAISGLILIFLLQGKDSTTMTTSDELIIGLPRIPKKIDSLHIATTWHYYILDNIYDTLVSIGPNDTYLAGLAEKWENKDNTEYTFFLKKDIRFSNGEPITAEEVAFSLKRLALKGALHIKLKNLLVDMENFKSIDDRTKGIEVIDKHTIRLVFKKPITSILFSLSVAETAVIHPKQVDKNLDIIDNSFTSGAYYVVNATDDEIVLEINKKSYKVDEKTPEKVKVVRVSSDDALDKIISGKIHYTMLLSVEDREEFNKIKSNDVLTPFYSEFNMVFVLYLNTRKPPFDDISKRFKLLDSVIKGKLTPFQADDLFVPGYSYFMPTTSGKADKSEITAMIDKHLSGKKVNFDDEITFVFPANFFSAKYGEKIKNFLNGLGFKVKYNDNKDNHQHYKEIDGNIVLLSLACDELEIYETLNYVFRPNTDTPFPFIDGNNTIIPMLDKLEFETDEQKKRKLIHDLDIEIMKNAQFIPLYHARVIYMLRKPYQYSALNRHEASLKFWKVRKP